MVSLILNTVKVVCLYIIQKLSPLLTEYDTTIKDHTEQIALREVYKVYKPHMRFTFISTGIIFVVLSWMYGIIYAFSVVCICI